MAKSCTCISRFQIMLSKLMQTIQTCMHKWIITQSCAVNTTPCTPAVTHLGHLYPQGLEFRPSLPHSSQLLFPELQPQLFSSLRIGITGVCNHRSCFLISHPIKSNLELLRKMAILGLGVRSQLGESESAERTPSGQR